MVKTYLKFLYNYLFRVKKSYSQTGEDLIVGFYLQDIKKGFYVDIGANDPVYMNNTWYFYKKSWRGICIEPNVSRSSMLRRIRPNDKIVNVGVGLEKGEMVFYNFEPDTISTFSLKEAEHYKNLGHKMVRQTKVPIMPLKDILSKYAGTKEIDLLSTDTEGFDMQVLQSNDWEKFRPKIIIIEAVEYHKDHSVRINKQFDDFLISKNYIKFADTYINAIYMEAGFAKTKKISV